MNAGIAAARPHNTSHSNDELCDRCVGIGDETGWDGGYAEGLADARRGRLADRADMAEELRAVMADAHRRGGHDGRWELCNDAVCVEVESWLHEEGKTK